MRAASIFNVLFLFSPLASLSKDSVGHVRRERALEDDFSVAIPVFTVSVTQGQPTLLPDALEEYLCTQIGRALEEYFMAKLGPVLYQIQGIDLSLVDSDGMGRMSFDGFGRFDPEAPPDTFTTQVMFTGLIQDTTIINSFLESNTATPALVISSTSMGTSVVDETPVDETPVTETPSEAPSAAVPVTRPPATVVILVDEPADAPAEPTDAPAEPVDIPVAPEESVPIVYPPMTDGYCLVDIRAQDRVYEHPWCAELPQRQSPIWGDPRYPACYPPGVPPWHPLDNIVVTLPNPAECDVAVSDTWNMCGWRMTYVQLTPGAVFTPPRQSQDAEYFLKLITGSVINVGHSGILRDDGQRETFVVNTPLTVHSAHVPYSTRQVTAGAEGAVFAWFVVPQDIMDTVVTSMWEAPATTVEGPFSELLTWELFETRANEAPGFRGEFWNMPGIKLNAYDGTHLNYNQWWTVREDNPIDGGYHDHTDLYANNTFAELHMTMYAATPTAGMQTELPGTRNLNVVPNPDPLPEGHATSWYARNDDPEVQLNLPIPPGYVHGPLWAVDNTTGFPIVNCNGGVVYPWHRLVMGTNPNSGPLTFNSPQRYQLWMPFEHPPQFAATPTQMLAHWPNTHLQTQSGNTPANCL